MNPSECITTSFQDDVAENQYGIYSLVVKEIFIPNGQQLVMINDRTISPSKDSWDLGIQTLYDALGEILGGEVVTDFRDNNERSHALERRFELPIDYYLSDLKEVCGFANGENALASWEKFFRDYPRAKGVLTFSLWHSHGTW